MVPNIAKTGRSFKGAMAYYLHDKRREGEAEHPTTAERVAWAETRNLATDDPATATRVMIATAKQADDLKAAAGIANTGRKSVAHVYSYSLSWHADEAAGLTRDDMVQAADATLKALDAEKLQAVIIAHRDTAHPHVHVIVNRVDPETGLMLSTSNDRRKLDAWARDYEKARGVIVTPKRQERDPQPDQSRKREDPAAKPAAKEKAPSEGQILKDLSDRQKRDHKEQWRRLSEDNKAKREAIYAGFAAKMKATAAQHKEDMKPLWRSFFAEQRRADRTRAKMERSLSGALALSITAARMQLERGAATDRGMIGQTLANLFSRPLREATFAQAKKDARRILAEQTKAALDQKMKAQKDARSAALTQQREAMATARAALIAAQDNERAKVREAWKQLYERRGKTLTPRQKEPPRMTKDFDTRAGRTWQELQEDREIMSGAKPTNPENMRRRDEDRAAEAARVGPPFRKSAEPAPQTRVVDTWERISKKNDEPREIKPLAPRSRDYER